MSTRRWLVAAPVALGLGLVALPLARASVDDGLAARATAALSAAGISDVDVTSDWAALRLSGPPERRSAALSAVGRMRDRDAVARVVYAVPADLQAQALPTQTPTTQTPPTQTLPATPGQTPTPTPAPSVVMSAALAVAGGDDRVVTLSGTVAGEQRHRALLAAVASWAPDATVEDDVAIADGEPETATAQAFPAFLRLAGRAAAGLAEGRLTLEDGAIEVSGLTTTQSAADQIASLTRDASGFGVAVKNTTQGPVTVAQKRLATVKGLKGVGFERGSEQLTSRSKATLDAVAKILRSAPAGVRVQIRGYTDSRGDDKLNLRLSQRRADAVEKYLLSKKVPAKMLSAKGFGEKDPLRSNKTEAGRAANRRIEFVVEGS